MEGAVLVSGATGFLGAAIVEELIAETAVCVYALVRPDAGRAAIERLESLWCERPVLAAALGSRVVAVEGDIEQELLGLDRKRYDELARDVRYVFHAAAEVGVNQTRKRFWDVNVRGTFNMLEFARRAVELEGLERFVHISTAYVAGRREGLVREQLFADGEFNSLYEWSKHEAELLVSSYGEYIPWSIVRPAQIVGDSRTGFISTFNTLYYPLKLYLKGGLRAVPAPRDLRVNMVPVDYVARLACHAAVDDRAACQVMHAAGPAEALPTLGELVEKVRVWARGNLRIELPAPAYVPFAPIAALGRVRNLREASRPKRKGFLRNLAVLAPYFYERRTYEVARGAAVAGIPFPDWHDWWPRLLEYACRRGFLNYTGRTVFEQMVYRLRPGASTRIDYFDVTAHGIEKHAGRDVRDDILHVAGTLHAAGIVSGDRIATIGVNSVRYFVLDAAIGLVGAANVPIYYTSPTSDVYDLVRASGARVLFAGTDRMLEGLDLERLGVPVVAMSDRSDVRDGIVAWQDFLAGVELRSSASGHRFAVASVPAASPAASAAPAAPATSAVPAAPVTSEATAAPASSAAPAAPAASAASAAPAAHPSTLPWVAPGQTATIRYTSGTTGTPKGVVFDQRQVRWMGEVMPAVLDWRTRNARKVRYLSFLPMSHVVEGILVAYAPYYILADIEMYYLNDFPVLADVLPQVRPNLFFSVPRFYEKVWNQFAATGPGKFWIGLPDGPAKRLLAWPLRHAVLRRAGLDRCRQLIVGSAPIGMDLLQNYRSLGVEIHNAFGVTEAPLITLSRLGANELGSVGQLLPDTEARIGDDGQVYIRGPQVTRGYDQGGRLEPAVDADGWYCTGDLASWSDQGNLVLRGRKKEILVTSYGKNIAPQKIEVLLKGMDGVSEALVVADARPFTTAMLWLEDDVDLAAFDFAALDAAMRDVNEQLSHPEQVKRWIIAARPLAVSAGELTPNLKVRRNVVAETRADLIEMLYDTWGVESADVVHRGEA